MSPLIIDFPIVSSLGNKVRKLIGAEKGTFLLRSFPDGESYLRVETDVTNRDVIVNASFVHPNDSILNLCFLSDALKFQGARSIGLLAPYLSYMRQDKVFLPGEALTSVTFANLISKYFSYLVTVEPHLHRYHHLGEIYSIPTSVVKVAPLITQWIRSHIKAPFLIGPDEESSQWVKEIAEEFPYIILKKIRFTDGHVKITWPQIGNLEKRVPILIDDIVSSGKTMLQVIQYLKDRRMGAPVCLAIHPIFAGNSYQVLQKSGAKGIVTCNTIPHPSNQIDLAPLLAQALLTNLEL